MAACSGKGFRRHCVMHRVPDGKLLPERIDAFVALCGCRLLKQFADLPRLDFWRLVKQIKSQMSLFRIFPPPTLPYVLSMGCAVQSGRTTVFSVEDNVKAVHTFRDGGCCERSDIRQPGVSPTNSVSPQSDGKMPKYPTWQTQTPTAHASIANDLKLKSN